MRFPEELHQFQVRFDYEGHDSFDDLARAVKAMSDAFLAYSRNREAEFRVKDFDRGSLICTLEANTAGFAGVLSMAEDFADLSDGRRTALMPETARKVLKQALEHVASIELRLESFTVLLLRGFLPLLEPSKEDSKRFTSHAGILDQVDLKANAFRILLPHGGRITCSPASPYLDQLSACLRSPVNRLRVSGDAKYHSDGFLPTRINVEHVELLTERPSVRELVSSVFTDVSFEEVVSALAEQEQRIERLVDQFVRDED